MSTLLVASAAFLASAVEMVEALTIVLAVGVTRGWRSTLVGVGVALVALAAITAALGPALVLIPIDALRPLVGGLLLVFGLQWLRKAILRASGHRALHDEDAIFQTQRAAAGGQTHGTLPGLDWYAFTVSFKGVLLEGLEVAFIVITVGAATNQITMAAVGAAAAVLLVGAIGLALNRPLSRVPENTLKYVVGLMLSAFGTFWAAEGAGVVWPGSDGAIPGLLAFYLAVSMILVKRLDHRRLVLQPAGQEGTVSHIVGFPRFWDDFIIGDDWLIAALVALCLLGLVVAGSADLWWVLPVVVVIALALSLWRAAVVA